MNLPPPHDRRYEQAKAGAIAAGVIVIGLACSLVVVLLAAALRLAGAIL